MSRRQSSSSVMSTRDPRGTHYLWDTIPCSIISEVTRSGLRVFPLEAAKSVRFANRGRLGW